MSAVSTNVTSTASIICYNKKLRCKMGYYILHTILLVIILLFIIAIICYHYAKYREKIKKLLATNNIKMENNELKKFVLKIVGVTISMA